MTFTASQLQKAQRWLHHVGSLHGASGPGGTVFPGTATYEEFSNSQGLGPPYRNRLMDLLLADVLQDCGSKGWPDLASLVIHQANTGLRPGPGDAWYTEHGFAIGKITLWQQWRDDCWNRIHTFKP